MDESEADAVAFEILGGGKWNDERWWYGLAQVCRRWRYLVLESASLLGLSLLCTYGTPIAEMLAHSPPLPLIIDYLDLYDVATVDDQRGLLFALEHRDRVRRIRFMQSVPILQGLIKALHGEFPNLEYLFIERHPYFRPSVESNVIVNIPETFRAPSLRYLAVMGFHIPVGSPLFTTMGNLVTLSLNFDIPWAYSHPNPLLQQLSPMARLGLSGNDFNSYHSTDDPQLWQRAVMRRVTPCLRRFGLQGTTAYLETLYPWAIIRFLERLQLGFVDQLFLIPRRAVLISSSDTLRLRTVRLTFFKDYLRVDAYSNGRELRTYRFSMSQGGRHLYCQVASAARFFHTLKTAFSTVEHLILKHDGHLISSDLTNEPGHAQWRELFRSFSKVKALYMDYRLVEQLSRSLLPDEGESPTDLLPALQEIWYSAMDDSDNAFFAELSYVRQIAGRPISVFQAVLPVRS